MGRSMLYKSLPDLQQQMQSPTEHHREDSLIDLSPGSEALPQQQRLYANTTDSFSPASNLQASASSLLDLPVEDEPPSVGQSQTYSNDFLPADEGHKFASSTFIGSSEYSHDSSFNSLPDGATYHEPPEEDVEQEQEDPFDTSNVMGNGASGHSTSGNQPHSETSAVSAPSLSSSSAAMVSDSDNSFENRRSIISQLLASHPAPNPFTGTGNVATNNGPGAPVREVQFAQANENSGPRQRTVSTMSESDGLGGLLPLTSPFSPPAFNPYDVVLGPNETIAGNTLRIHRYREIFLKMHFKIKLKLVCIFPAFYLNPYPDADPDPDKDPDADSSLNRTFEDNFSKIKKI
jgi:hypothetical protein